MDAHYPAKWQGFSTPMCILWEAASSAEGEVRAGALGDSAKNLRGKVRTLLAMGVLLCGV